MREFRRAFLGNRDDNWARHSDDQMQNADKFVDETIERIVANATHIRKLQELKKKRDQKTTTTESNLHGTFSKSNCIKDDDKKSFQLQNFNLAPAFVIRKRKLYDGPDPTNSDMRSPGVKRYKVSEGQDTLNHFDPDDDAPVVFPRNKCAENIMKKQPMVSPIPDFIAKEFPLDFTKQPTPMMAAKPRTTRTELANITSDSLYQSKSNNYEGYLLNADVEEPVKNSVFWLYRSFPHIA